MNIKNLILFISIVTLVSCKSSQFIYENGTKKIELVSPHEIVLNEGVSDTKVTLKLTNIKPNKLTVIGVGVRLDRKSISDDYMYLTIKTRADYYKGQKFYELRVTYKDNGEIMHHKFEIPLTRKNK
nr:hypothetical protein [uncultured Psychroserpens sp.]